MLVAVLADVRRDRQDQPGLTQNDSPQVDEDGRSHGGEPQYEFQLEHAIDAGPWKVPFEKVEHAAPFGYVEPAASLSHQYLRAKLAGKISGAWSVAMSRLGAGYVIFAFANRAWARTGGMISVKLITIMINPSQMAFV